MIGGEQDVVQHLDPIFTALAPGNAAAPARRGAKSAAAQRSKAICIADHGAGHFVKMVHNGIEYGLMAAYAEGLNILQHANVGKKTRARPMRRRRRCRTRILPV